MNYQKQSTPKENSNKKLKILLHFLKEEIIESNYKLVNVKKSILYNKLRLYIKQNEQKKEMLLNNVKNAIENAKEQKSLNQIMVYKKMLQALAFSEFTDIQKLSDLDTELNNYIFEQEEDPFQYYNNKVYQIIINNKFLFHNRKQLVDQTINIDSTSEDVRLVELFTHIFPKQRDIFHQLTELELIVQLMSMIVLKQYKTKLKCTVYGSYMMGFQLSKTSDIDVSIELEDNSVIQDIDSKRKFLKLLEETLYANEKYEIYSFINAQVPGFQVRKQSIFNPYLTVKVDFTVCNNVGISKTSLLKIYSSLSKRVQQLVCLFKYYVQTKNISQDKSLSSIAQTNMVIYFLLKQNYLPNVQKHFSNEEKQNYLLHHKIDEISIKNILKQNGDLMKINQTPLFQLFKELISFYNQIANDKSQTTIISLLNPVAEIQGEQYQKYSFIILEFYDDDHNLQPNQFFDFRYFAQTLTQTHQFIQQYENSKQLGEFINQIFNTNTQYDIDQKNKQELIDEFDLDIHSQSEDEG